MPVTAAISSARAANSCASVPSPAAISLSIISGSKPATCSSSARTTIGSRRSRSPSSAKARGRQVASGAYAASSVSRDGPVTSAGCPGSSTACSAPTNPSSAATSAAWPTSDAIARSDFSAGRPSSSQLACASPKRTSIIALRIGVTCATASSSNVSRSAASSDAVDRAMRRRRGGARACRPRRCSPSASAIARSSEPPAGSVTATGARAARAGAAAPAWRRGRATPSPRASGGLAAGAGARRERHRPWRSRRRPGDWTLPRGGALGRGRARRLARGRGARRGRFRALHGRLRRLGRARGRRRPGHADEAFGAGALGGAFGGDSASFVAASSEVARKCSCSLPTQTSSSTSRAEDFSDVGPLLMDASASIPGRSGR